MRKKILCMLLAGTMVLDLWNIPVTAQEQQEESETAIESGEEGISRIYGNDRNETSRAVADELKSILGVETFDAIIIATGKNYADALSGSYLAKVKNAPILLTNGKDKANEDVIAYVKANANAQTKIYILGGIQAVPDVIDERLSDYEVIRLDGNDRYETNQKILAEAGIQDQEDLLIATGAAFPDSLSASATGRPILLVSPKKSLDKAQEKILDQFKDGKIYILGGESAVSKQRENEIINTTKSDLLIRLQGENRYETSVAIAKTFFADSEKAVIVSGKDFPDGLCGGVLAALSGAPLILTKTGDLTAADYAAEQGITAGYVLGGSNALENDVVNTLFDLGTIKVTIDPSGYESEMWEQVCEVFTIETGIKVELNLFSDLNDDLSAAEENGELPDITNLSMGNEFTDRYVEERKLADLTDLLSMTVPGEKKMVSEKLVNGIDETSSTNLYLDGELYLAPTFYSPCGLFYNAGLFEEKGWEVPATWDEMWELGEEAKEENISLFTYPTTGYLDAFVYSLLYSAGGTEFFDQVSANVEGIWETDEAQKCLDIIAKLAEYTHPQTVENANDEDYWKNQQLFMDNEALFIPNGSWFIDETEEYSRADGFQWGMTAVPAVDTDGDCCAYIWHDCMWIPEGSENKESAKRFLAFLYSDTADRIFADNGAKMPVKGMDEFLDGNEKIIYSVFNDDAKAVTGGFYGYQESEETGNVREVIFDPINDLVSGTLTKEAWIENLLLKADQMRGETETSAPDWTEYDARIEQIRKEVDLAEREKLMHEAEDELMETGAVVPLYYYNAIYLQKSDVEDIYADAYGNYYFAFAKAPNNELSIYLAPDAAQEQLDPALNVTIEGASLAALAFSGLYTYDQNGTLVPELAESYTKSEDGLTYTFTMREGLQWSDGEALDAKDLVYSWNRLADPDTGAAYSYMTSVIAENEDGTLEISASEDGRTFTVQLNAPCPYFMYLCAFPAFYPVPQHAVEAAEGYEENQGAWAAKAGFVTSGPMKLTQWVYDESMVYEPNEKYWAADQVSLNKMSLMLNTEEMSAYEAFQKGVIQFTGEFDGENLEELINTPEYHQIDALGTHYCGFNVKSGLFAGLDEEQAANMRKAISMLIDREAIVSNIAGANQKAANTFIPAGMADGNGGVFKVNDETYTYPNEAEAGYYSIAYSEEKVEEARELLKTCGYEFDEEGKLSEDTPLKFSYLTNDAGLNEAIGEAIQENLAVIGIDMQIEACDWSEFQSRKSEGRFDLCRGGWVADFNDPISMLEIFESGSDYNDMQFGR